MNTLNIENPKNKTVYVVLTKMENNALLNEQRYNLCEDILNEHNFDFVTVEVDGGESKFNPKSLVKLIGRCPIESHGVDVPDFAKAYLMEEIDAIREKVAKLEAEYATMDKTTDKAQNMASWIDVMRDDIAEKEREYRVVVKPKWVVKRILEISEKFDVDEVYVLHFGNEETMETIKAEFEAVENTKCIALVDKRTASARLTVFA